AHAIAVIGGLEPVELRAREPRDDGLEQLARCERIAVAGYEQYRPADIAEMASPIRAGFPGRMQRKREEREPARLDPPFGNRMRRHPAAERMPAEPHRHVGARCGRRIRALDLGDRDVRRVDALAAVTDEREIEAQGADTAA